MTVLYPVVHLSSVAAQARAYSLEGKNKGVVGWHRLSLSETSLCEESEAGSVQTWYQAVERVAETDTHVYIYLNSTGAYVVRRTAVTKGDLAAFLGELKAWMASATA